MPLPPRAKRLLRLLWRFWYRVIILKSSPTRIAGGLALGVFVGLTPTIGFQMLIAALLAPLFRCNPLSAMAGVYITNPVTFIPIYAFNYEVGCAILGFETGISWQRLREMPIGEATRELMSGSLRLLLALWVGSLVVAIPSAAVSFFGMRTLVHYLERWRRRRRFKRLEKRIRKVAVPPPSADQPPAPPAPSDPPLRPGT